MLFDNLKESLLTYLYGERVPYTFEKLHQILASLREIEVFEHLDEFAPLFIVKRNPQKDDVLGYFQRLPHATLLSDGENYIPVRFFPPVYMRLSQSRTHVKIRFYGKNGREAYLKGRRDDFGSGADTLDLVHSTL